MEETSEMELEVMAAEREVDNARERLVAELENASESGRQAIARVVHKTRPVAIGVAAIAGAAILAGAISLLRGALARRRSTHSTQRFLLAPPQRSLGSQIARQVLTSAAGTLAAAAARHAVFVLEQRAEASRHGHTPLRRAPGASRASDRS